MITIRRADSADLPWLLTQCRAFSQFFGSQQSLMPDDETASDTLRGLMDEDVGCFFVAENGQRLGFIAGLLSPHYFNPALLQLTELLWWVSPEHRGSSAGARLLDAFDAFGRAHADWVVFSLEEKSPVNPRALERRGYTLHERSYLLETPCHAR